MHKQCSRMKPPKGEQTLVCEHHHLSRRAGGAGNPWSSDCAGHRPCLVSFKASEACELDTVISPVTPASRKVAVGEFRPWLGEERVEKMEMADARCLAHGTLTAETGVPPGTNGTDQVSRGKDGATFTPTRCPERVYTEEGWSKRVILRSFLSLLKCL